MGQILIKSGHLVWVRQVFCVLLLFMGQETILAQDIEKVELDLSNAVLVWQRAATKLDNSVRDLEQLRKQYDEIQHAREWMEADLQARRDRKAPRKEIRKAVKAFRHSTKKVKRVTKLLRAKEKEINHLSAQVEKQKEIVNKLTFEQKMLEEGHGDSGKKVYSGYFPKYKSFYHAPAKRDLLRYPPPFKCVNAFDGQDPVSKKHRIEQLDKVFFTKHPDRYPLIDGEPYLTCSSYFTLLEGGQYFLNLEFKIHTVNPRQSFGYLERGSRLIITFIDGDTLTLNNNNLNMGTLNKKKGTVTFRGQYPISLYSQNFVKKKDVDKVRVEWARGYEDYEVYHVDLLRKQLRCF